MGERERERTTGVVFLSGLVFKILMLSNRKFALVLCLVFHSRAPTTCSGRERRRERKRGRELES